MKLCELISQLEAIRDSIKDRDPADVEVVFMDPSAIRLGKIVRRDMRVWLEKWNTYPEPPSDDSKIWNKQVRVATSDFVRGDVG